MATEHRQGVEGTQGLLRAMGAALAAVLLLFAGYEAVEHLFLQEADGRVLETMQRVRITAAVLLAGGLAGWLILRDARPVLSAGVLPDGHAGRLRLDTSEKQVHYARWFILMRWVAIAVAAIAVFVTVEVAALLPVQVGPSLGALIVLLTVLNLCYTIFLRHCGSYTAFLVFQVYADILILILLLHFSGGIENPLTALLLLHVIIAGIVLGRAHAYLVAGAASALFALLAWAECYRVLPHYTLRLFPHQHYEGLMLHAAHDPLYAASRVVLQAVVLFLVAYFTTTLVRRIRQDEGSLQQLADQARAQAQMLEQALDTTGTALCVWDRELEPYWANSRWSGWQATSPALAGFAEAASSPARATMGDGHARTSELRTGANGGTRVFEVTTAPLRDDQERIQHVAMLTRDVTEQRDAEARARRAERLAGVGELAGQVAHEVNNPIAIISAKCRLLLRSGREPVPAEVRADLAKIAELADRVARIAQGLLSYCRPAPGLRQPLDVRLPVRRVLAYLEARAAAAGVRVEDELPPLLPAVQANAAELEQVFLNLFINALDAMPGGGVLRVGATIQEASAQAACGPACARLALEVADTGSGIDPTIRDRMFEPFLTTKGGRGTGLGLSICQGLVRSHGGDIMVESEPGHGTRMVVLLPLAIHQGAAAAPVTTPAHHA
jgi:signal transduction histidine kinase